MDLLPGPLQHRALAFDAAALELAYVAAPGLVSGLALLGAPAASLAAMAGAALAAATLPRPAGRDEVGGGFRLPPLPALPIFLLSGVMGYVEGSIVVQLAPLLSELHQWPGLAGLLLGIFSAASVAGGVAYGAWSGRWPGSPRTHAVALLVGLGLATLLIALAPSLVALAVAAMGLFLGLTSARTLVLGAGLLAIASQALALVAAGLGRRPIT